MEYSINANKALRIEKQIAETEIVLTQKRQTAKETISMSLDKNSNCKARWSSSSICILQSYSSWARNPWYELTLWAHDTI